jgi:SPP1 family phage portal protein
MSTVCGYAGRLFYLLDTEVRAMLVNPWECVFIGDSIEEPQYSVRFYETSALNEKGEETTVYNADVYDSIMVTHFTRGDKNEEFSEGMSERHMMPANPLIGFANNAELLGDAEPVINAIDGYDRTVSDINSELEQFRLAYLAIIGASIDETTLQKVRRTGAFSLPDKDSSIAFITKTIDDAVIEHHLDRLERNIYRFSRTPNMNDAAFSGDITGVALKYKFRSFEDKCKTAELKFKKALRSQYKLLCALWALGGASMNYLDIDFTFTRNYPQNLIEEIDFLQRAKGIISEETAFSLVSFIENPDKEIEALESQQMADLDQFVMRNEAMAATSHKEDKNQDSGDGEGKTA